ncbi:acetyl/propionyl/methylcrotonyl-CoA carboxylase subunit alpha [Novosphingobium profundi]|uniref:acetyl/propionyl/methylcrotonyl-CoA carboxylase subunit alpha n=1 Tax=Novosphingobium profundi TaxID=1774954 RepID=UPI001BD9C77C|nr:acetyl/propionyl/methylcrotonyl-CoA carboxylase subunit alpha [Novosphingobium profundi]MBT0668700.1 acetyl/propionyl/methylcrotonyl-CoA carboxylase subunit alpha [Novosphingobium profundi]
MIRSLLIANRGEIACRVIRTARRLGIRTVAVHSDADAGALHVAMADVAHRIGPASAAQSYLCGEKIIAAAKLTGAEAIHPGYGFLSENAEFAEAVIAAGLVWVGPSPSSIRAMGLKDAAKALMEQAGVPVTPGYLGDDQSVGRLAVEAARIGYPILIKAVAGGGGKGMRRVEDEAGFADALASCRREAQASFGNDRVLLEKYIATPRHIEVQVFGDSHGNAVHLFERDCSLQRRHQKVIEEAPAPGMDPATREALCAAALRAARAVDYVGAGTIEFIADGSGPLDAERIWFMEMNTRLQVEHPVTEEVTGVDLVEWQLRVASGEPLPRRQEELSLRGWAMEARLYAEDPARGFLPSTGRLEWLEFGEAPSGRVETGVAQGDEVSPHYDPMIAKLVAHGADREEARQRLSTMLEGSAVWPVRSNAPFLVQALEHPDFVAGRVDTGLVARDGEALARSVQPSREVLEAAANALVGRTRLMGFRLNAPPRRVARFRLEGEPIDIALGEGCDEPVDAVLLAERGEAWQLTGWRRDGVHGAAAGSGAILAPMPGKVIAVAVEQGERVTRGQKLLTLEAMKMEHTLVAPFDGVVATLAAVEGQQVALEAALARIEEEVG